MRDLTNQRFGRLVARSYVKGSKWLCDCDCGSARLVPTGNLTCGLVKSCGCIRKQKAREAKRPRPKRPTLPIIQALRAVREARGLRQVDMANLVGYDLAYISCVESGRAKPSLTFLINYAQVLGQALTIVEQNNV